MLAVVTWSPLRWVHPSSFRRFIHARRIGHDARGIDQLRPGGHDGVPEAVEVGDDVGVGVKADVQLLAVGGDRQAQQIARALRTSAEQLDVRAGIASPDRGAAGSVELAILGDPGLTRAAESDAARRLLGLPRPGHLDKVTRAAGANPADPESPGQPH